MRNINQIAIVSSMLITLLSCSSDKDVDVNPGTTTNPVEGNAANTTYKPAFAGQTRVSGVQTNTPYQGVAIATGLSSPWGIKSLPDGRLLITEKTGTMRIATTAGVLSTPITGIPAVNAANQGGLLGLTIDPDFTTNRMIYWVYAEATTGGNNTAVAKGKLSADEKTIEGATVIYRAKPANASTLHYGGRILFDKSGFLVVSTGERSVLETRPLAQSVASGLGKVVRLTKEGQPASGNPTFTGTGALSDTEIRKVWHLILIQEKFGCQNMDHAEVTKSIALKRVQITDGQQLRTELNIAEKK